MIEILLLLAFVLSAIPPDPCPNPELVFFSDGWPNEGVIHTPTQNLDGGPQYWNNRFSYPDCILIQAVLPYSDINNGTYCLTSDPVWDPVWRVHSMHLDKEPPYTGRAYYNCLSVIRNIVFYDGFESGDLNNWS